MKPGPLHSLPSLHHKKGSILRPFSLSHSPVLFHTELRGLGVPTSQTSKVCAPHSEQSLFVHCLPPTDFLHEAEVARKLWNSKADATCPWALPLQNDQAVNPSWEPTC